MDQIYKKSYSEILEILKYIPSEEYARIPKEKINFFEEHKDPSYQFKYNPFKSLNEQEVLRETKILIVGLFRDVVATEKQKEKLDKILAKNEQEYQNKIKEEFNYDDLFHKNKESKDELEKETSNSTKMTVYKENIFLKIYRLFVRKFGKKN